MASPSAAAAELLTRYSGLVIAAAMVATVLLVVPMLLLASDETASTEPGGEVFDLRDDVDAKLRSSTYTTAYVAEARDGDILRQAPLLELYRNEQALRAADRRGDLTPGDLEPQPFLKAAFDTDTGVTFTGLVTIADALQSVLTLAGTSLEHATDDQVKIAVARLLGARLPKGWRTSSPYSRPTSSGSVGPADRILGITRCVARCPRGQ